MKHLALILFVALLCGIMPFIQASQTEVLPPLINPDGSINLSLRKHPYVPKEGDVIRCEDGSNYTISCIDGYEPVALPESNFAQLNLPKADAIHFSDVSGNYLFLRNFRETARMASTLSDFLNIDAASIQLDLPEDVVPVVADVWDVKQITALPGYGAYGVESWDIFKNGAYLWTSYEVGRI